jgi:hypothetical protein
MDGRIRAGGSLMRTYDGNQRAAELLTCHRCGTAYYVSRPELWTGICQGCQWRAVGGGADGMTLPEAIRLLVTEYRLLDALEQWDDVVREDVRDSGYEGLTDEHPAVQRYREVCHTVRRWASAPEAPTQEPGEGV